MKVFISSTYRDLKEDRWSLLISLKKAGFDAWGMEFFAAEPETPKEVCLREVRTSDLMILVIGDSYGSLDSESGKSFTHLEYEEAKRNGIDVLAFIKYSIDGTSKDRNLVAFCEQVKTEQCPDYFSDPIGLRDVVWPSFFKYIKSKGKIVGKISVFQNFADFFERFLDEEYFFNHCHTLVGRDSELATLRDFVRTPSKRIAIVKGPGGVGKSKLLYEFFNFCEQEGVAWDVRFLSAQTEFQLENLAELPTNPVCIVIEDAHKRDDLDKIVDAATRSQYRSRTKLIISTRPSGVDSIKQLLASCDPQEEEWLDVNPLDTRTHALQLSQSVLGPQYKANAEKLVHASDGNALVITIGGSLIRKGQIEVALLESEDFRDRALEKLLEDSIKALDEKYNLDSRGFLATIAGIGPIDITLKEIQESLSEDFGIDRMLLSQLIDDLGTRGLVLQRGRKLRVCPDVLSDHLLLSRSFDRQRRPTSLIDHLVKTYGTIHFSNILRNTAEVEYSIHLKGQEPSLLDNVWRDIWDFLHSANYQEISDLLERIKPMAVFKPGQTLEIVKWLLKPNNLVNDKRQGPLQDYVNAETVLKKLPGILKRIAWNPDYTTEVCEILWELANGSLKNVNPNPYPEHPFRVFTELARLDNHNYFSIVQGSLEAVERIIGQGKHRSTHYKIQQILEGTLSQEVEEHTLHQRAVTFSFARVFCLEPRTKIREVRDRAISLLEILSKDNDPAVILRTADSLIDMLYVQGRGFTEDARDEELDFLTGESERALAILERILSEKRSVVANHVILDKLRSQETRFIPTIRNQVEVVSEKYFEDDLEYKVQYYMSHDWAEYVLGEEYDVTEKRFQEYQESTASELWKACDYHPERFVGYLSRIVEDLGRIGIGCEARMFQDACARREADKIPKVIDLLLQFDDLYLAFSIAYWFPHISPKLKYSTAMTILKTGKSQHKRGLASASYSFKDMPREEMIEIVKNLMGDPEKEVRTTIIPSLGRIHRDCGQPDEIKDIICNCDVDGDALLLNGLFNCVNERYGLDPDTLTSEQIDNLMKQIEYVNVLDSNHYRIGEFLAYMKSKSPKKVVEMLLRRVQKKVELQEDRTKKREFQPFPHLGYRYPLPIDVSGHPEFKDCVDLIVTAVERDDWQYYFWCPIIFRWLDPNFSSTSKEYLRGLLAKADAHRVRAIGCLMKSYESEIVFAEVDFVKNLLTKASDISAECYKNVQSQLASIVFSGARMVSPPGQPDAHFVSIAERCKAILTGNDVPTVVANFYRGIQAEAEEENRRKLERDRIEQEEEEI